jgi:small subunit ribosomal protein S16
VALLGNFNPHTKEAKIDKEKAEYYLKNGAQPSDRVVRLLKAEGVKLPSWVKVPSSKERSIRNIEKLRKNRPAEEVQEEPAAVVEETTEEVAEEQVAESTEENETPSPDAEETEEPKKEEPEA